MCLKVVTSQCDNAGRMQDSLKYIGTSHLGKMDQKGSGQTGWYYCGVRGKVGGYPYHTRCVPKSVEPK